MTNYVLSKAEKAEIVRRAVAGERPVDLAREFGVTRQSIHGVLRVRAVPVRVDPCGTGESEWVTLVQAARLLGINRNSLAGRIDQGWIAAAPEAAIPPEQRARRAFWYLRRDEVLAMLAEDERSRDERANAGAAKAAPLPACRTRSYSVKEAENGQIYDRVPEIAEVIYLAGLFDGEGCILFGRRKTARGTPTFTLGVVLANTHYDTIAWLQRTFGGTFGEDAPAVRHEHGWAPIWSWRAAPLVAASVLRLLLPYLRVKHEQAVLALELYDRMQTYLQTHRGVGTGRPTPTEAEIAWREAQAARIAALKKQHRPKS